MKRILFWCLVVAPLICPAQIGPRPNVILIVSDDQRPDTIRALGNPAIETPHLDGLVRDGTAFSRAIVANPHCTPSRAEILTGVSGFRNLAPPFGRRMNPELTFFAEALRDSGYQTWYSGKWMNDGHPKTRGYDETDGLFSGGGGGRDQPPTVPFSHNGRRAEGYRGWTFKSDDNQVLFEQGIGLTGETDRHIADAAIRFIQRRGDKPYFLHVNFTAPHDPLIIPSGYENRYDPAGIPLPPNHLPQHPFDHGNFFGRDEELLSWPRTPEDVRRELAAYYAVVSHLDEQVGRIRRALDHSGQGDHTIIIFTSDHGLALGSHGLMGKQNMYEHTVGVPLVITGPGLPKGRRLTTQVYLRDLFPTVCELVGTPVPATVEGRSLVPALTGQTEEIHPEVYAYWHPNAIHAVPGVPVPVQRMVRTDRWKLIYYSNHDRYQLFDLADDPYEKVDLSASPFPLHQETLTDLRGRLDAWFLPRIAAWKRLSQP